MSPNTATSVGAHGLSSLPKRWTLCRLVPTYLYPPLGRSVFMFVVLFALIGSAAKIFWLIVFGVDEEKSRAVEAAVER